MMFYELLNTQYYNNTGYAYLLAVVILFVSVLVVKIVETKILSHLKRLSEKTDTKLDDFFIKLIKMIFMPLAIMTVVYTVANTLNLNDTVLRVINMLYIAILTFLAVRFSSELLSFLVRTYCAKRGDDQLLERSMKGILRVFQFIIWGVAISFFLDNLGFKISAVITGLGIGGVAVALAAQAVLGDLFSYFSILFDRPFDVGDFIIIGDYLGVVDSIGIKTTRLNSLGGEQLVFSNTDLTNSRVRNYKRMEKRRVVFKIGVVYQTAPEVVKLIPDLIKNIISSIDSTVLDRSHFSSFGDFSLMYETVYYVVGSDYNKYMDIQQKINFAIMDKFKEMKIEFAYPTQSIFLTKNNEIAN